MNLPNSKDHRWTEHTMLPKMLSCIAFADKLLACLSIPSGFCLCRIRSYKFSGQLISPSSLLRDLWEWSAEWGTEDDLCWRALSASNADMSKMITLALVSTWYEDPWWEKLAPAVLVIINNRKVFNSSEGSIKRLAVLEFLSITCLAFLELLANLPRNRTMFRKLVQWKAYMLSNVLITITSSHTCNTG